MTPIILQPRAAPADRLRIWLGLFQQTQAPDPVWHLDGAPVAPRALRPVGSVRTPDLLPANRQPHEVARAFAGLYEFDGLQPDTLYNVTVHIDGHSRSLSTRTLPATVPHGLDGWFNVLLVSCFHQAEDRPGRAGQLVSQLRAGAQPNLTFLLGDQVYLDLPTLQNFPDDAAWLAQKFEDDYTANWWGPPGYGNILAVAPSVSVPDDHEYWNNFPNLTPVAQNTWTPAGRQRWRRAAEAMYRAFQLPALLAPGDPFILDVPPLSFFLADMRHGRLPGAEQLMTPAAHRRLNEWVTRLIDRRWFGVFVSGQSLFAEPVHDLFGRVADYQLPNYRDDFQKIVSALVRLVDAGRPVVCVTGDVHWGRVSTAQDSHSGRTAIYEVISSPSSLVTFVGKDQIDRARTFLRELLGRTSDSWPRHPQPKSPPAFFAQAVQANRFVCPEPPAENVQRGNHVATLGFRQMGGGVDMRVLYHEIPLDGSIPEPKVLGPFTLR